MKAAKVAESSGAELPHRLADRVNRALGIAWASAGLVAGRRGLEQSGVKDRSRAEDVKIRRNWRVKAEKATVRTRQHPDSGRDWRTIRRTRVATSYRGGIGDDWRAA
jgi:hypothetical protein